MKLLVPTLLVAASLPTAASAGYIANKATWDQLGAGGKGAYAMGVYDASNIIFGDDDKETQAVKQGRTRCLADLRLLPGQLAAWVDEAYASDPAAATRPPSTVLVGQVSARCMRQIEEERVKLGLPAAP